MDQDVVPFADRAEAGRLLAHRLSPMAGPDVAVLGLPRGGVPVAFEVARGLEVPLDVVVVRKLGVPQHPELAMGALGEDGGEVLDRALVATAGVTEQQLRRVEEHEAAELDERVRRLRARREPLDLTGLTALVVDDGLATGATAHVACQVARRRGATRVVVAAPVGPRELAGGVGYADEVVLLAVPEPFTAVGLWYRDFTPTTDQEVASLLGAA